MVVERMRAKEKDSLIVKKIESATRKQAKQGIPKGEQKLDAFKGHISDTKKKT